MNVITLNLPAALKLKDEEFFELATANHHLKIERTAKGDLIIMPPTGGESGKKNANLTADLVIWNRGANLGVVFDSSTEFHLPHLRRSLARCIMGEARTLGSIVRSATKAISPLVS